MASFFDKKYQTPVWLAEKKLSRRTLLKSAMGAASVAALPAFIISAKQQQQLLELKKRDPWLTLDSTLSHLLPKSAASNDINAQDIHALNYLYQIITVHPTKQDEKDFILEGVGWLNNYARKEYSQAFAELTFEEKELLLRQISHSNAGENWLTTLINYLFEAMLSPPSYGGNPQGVGWQWLEHQAGFPLPEKGQRYFELPPRASAKKVELKPNRYNQMTVRNINIKRSSKA